MSKLLIKFVLIVLCCLAYEGGLCSEKEERDRKNNERAKLIDDYIMMKNPGVSEEKKHTSKKGFAGAEMFKDLFELEVKLQALKD